jgi:hypothetical protein
VGVLPLLGTNSAVKAYIGCALALLSTIYFREFAPYRVEFTNFLGVVAQYMILLAFLAALMIHSESESSFGLSDLGLGCILLVGNMFIVALAMFLGWNRYKKELKVAEQNRAKVLKIEWAVEFSNNKFQTTLTSVIRRAVPTSHALCYYYTSLKQAQLSARVGEIPATSEGIIVSMLSPAHLSNNNPNDLAALKLMGPLAESREAVLCLSIPHALLFKFESSRSYRDDDVVKVNQTHAQHLRVIPSDLLVAMGTYKSSKKNKKNSVSTNSRVKAFGSSSSSSSSFSVDKVRIESSDANQLVEDGRDQEVSVDVDKQFKNGLMMNKTSSHHHRALTLSAKCALRAYQLKDANACFAPRIHPSEFYHPITPNYQPSGVLQPITCSEYTNIMSKIRYECECEQTVPLYHYTTMSVADLILEGGFRMSTQGQGDGGMYFSTLGPSSYDLGSPQYEENIIIDCFGKERLEEYRGKHKLDVVFIYGINPKCVEQAPGGRENAKMINKVMFELFSKPKLDGSYYLRPDFIKAALYIDGTSKLPLNRMEALKELELEKEKDRSIQMKLKEMERILKENSSSTRSSRMLLHVQNSSQFSMGVGNGKSEWGDEEQNGDDGDYIESSDSATQEGGGRLKARSHRSPTLQGRLVNGLSNTLHMMSYHSQPPPPPPPPPPTATSHQKERNEVELTRVNPLVNP